MRVRALPPGTGPAPHENGVFVALYVLGIASGSAAPASTQPGPAPGSAPGRRALAAYLLAQSALLAGLHVVVPRFFWLDDAQIQFTPMSWWLGRRLAEGELPLLDPDQGMAANLTADMQYGVLDVVRWPFLLWAGAQEDLALVATVHAWLAVLVLGCACLSLLLRYGVQPALAAGTSLGAATSGFLLWWGSAWSPLMWSVAALVWLWAATESRRWHGVLGAGLACAAVVCAGNPYILPLVPVLLGCLAWTRWRVFGRALLRDRPTRATALALLAGGVLSLPTVVNALDMAEWMWRPAPEYTLGFAGGGVNLLDILVGGTTLLGGANVPIMSTAVIALPLVAFVQWRRAVQHPGVLVAGAVWAVSVLITQLPTFMLGFRMPWRLLGVVQVCFALLVVLAFTAASRLDRRRVVLAAALLLLQFLVALLRAPVLWRWHALGLVLAAVALLAVLVVVRPAVLSIVPWSPRWGRPVAAAAVVLACGAPLVVQVAMGATLQERHEALVSGPTPVAVFRPNTMGYDVGTTVSDFRNNALATDTSLSVYSFGALADNDDRGWAHGVLGGNANLPADLRVGYGSLAVWPRGVQEHLEADYQSGLRLDQPGLTVVPEGAPVPWVDLLSGNRVLLGRDGAVPPAVAEYFARHWVLVSVEDGWREYRRAVPLPGRVTMVVGAGTTVRTHGPDDGVAALGRPFERYEVSTGDDGGRVVFRTPYWNGFSATLDGRPVEVSAYAGSVLQVVLPPGVDAGMLEVSFAPIGARLLLVCLPTGAVLLLIAVGLAVRTGRRNRRRGPADVTASERMAGSGRVGTVTPW